MYASVRRYTAAPGSIQRFSPRVENEFVPLLRAVPGFVSFTVMEGGSENGRDVILTVSIFQSREGADESAREAAQWIRRNLGEFEPSLPQITTGNVLLTSTSQFVAASYTR